MLKIRSSDGAASILLYESRPQTVTKNRPFQRNGRLSVVRPVRFERMAFRVGAVLCEVFASQRLLKRRSSPTFCVVFVCFLHLLGLPIFGGSSLVVAAVALAILGPVAGNPRPADGIRTAPRGRTAPAGCNPVLSARYSTHDSILLCGYHLPQRG